MSATPTPIRAHLRAVECAAGSASKAFPVAQRSLAMRVIRFLAILTAVAALSAPASGASWTTQTTFGPTGLAESALTGVSCVSAAWCMAVGVDDNGPVGVDNPLQDVGSFAESWNGSAWTVAPTAASAGPSPGLDAISCVSATFCVAVGQTHSLGRQGLGNQYAYGAQRALVEVWNGLAWTVQPIPGAAGSASGLFAVSCISSRFCIAVGERGRGPNELAEIWDGTSWRVQNTPTVAKYGTWPMGIACLASDACTMVGGYNTDTRPQVAVEEPLAERWNGHRWSVQHPPAHGLYAPRLTGVSCPSRSFCLASGVYQLGNGTIFLSPFAERWNAQRWTPELAGLPKESSLNGISCISAVNCVAVGQFDPRLLNTGPGGTEPLVERWNGRRWARLAIPNAPEPPPSMFGEGDQLDPALLGIACVPHSGCAAVGAQAHGADSATLAQGDMGAPTAASAN